MSDMEICPFCKGNAHVVRTNGTQLFHSACTVCLARTGNATTVEGAKRLWNRRDNRGEHRDVAELIRGTVW